MRTTTVLVLLAGGLATGVGAAYAGEPTLAAELLADASGRPALPAPANETFTVDVHGLMIFRYDWNHRGDDESGPILFVGGGNKDTVGFQNAYTKLQVGGHIFSEDWSYGVQFKFTESDGTAALDDAWGSYAFGNSWVLKWGQFKLPLLREELVGDTYQLTANRSVVNSVFTQSRSQGVQLSTEQQQVRFAAAFSDGLSTKNTDFTSSSEADWALTGRVEWKWSGEWKQAKDFTSFPESPFFGMVGGAAHFQSGGDTFATSDTDVFEGTVDVSVEGSGWNVYAAGIYRRVEPATGSDVDDWGFLAQGGIFVGPKWELFARYDIVVPDSDRMTSDDFSTVTFGANDYLMQDSHAAKFTVDFEWFLDKQSQSIAPASTLTGLLASDKDSQWNIRAQMQLLF
jgi:hypothetical protein